MQNIEKQYEANRPCGTTSAFDHEIPLLDNNVPQIRLSGPKGRGLHHERIDI
jgi:hypothetical protein